MDNIIIYNLVLRRNGDYNVIEINSIPNIDLSYPNEIGAIDTFTSKYSEAELRILVENNNLVAPEYLNGTFKIVSNLKHNLPILTKERFMAIYEFKENIIEIDRSFKDKLYGYYKKIIEKIIPAELFSEYLKNFKLALDINNYKEVLNLIEKIPYAKARSIYFMISDEIDKRKNDKIRKLEKSEEVA